MTDKREVGAFSGLRALVVGMEKSGLASIQVLLHHGALVRATDLKPQSPAALGVPFELSLIHI